MHIIETEFQIKIFVVSFGGFSLKFEQLHLQCTMKRNECVQEGPFFQLHVPSYCVRQLCFAKKLAASGEGPLNINIDIFIS